MSIHKAALLAVACGVASAIELTVSSSGGNASSPLLYGFIFEDINHSGDGVLHGNLLQNNGFQGNSPNLTAWSAVGGAEIAQDSSNPLTDAITSTLSITGTSGTIGASNAGYVSIRVTPNEYANYFWVKGTYEGNITVSLVDSDDTVLGSTGVPVSSNSSAFSYYETSFSAVESTTGNSSWHFTFDAATATDGGLNLGLPQLFPPTFHNRKNGLNAEVAEVLDSAKGSFLRFPGGNNLEGTSVENRWTWNNTIGPVEDRPGRQGNWGYPTTDAIGLVEFLLWCQDMGLTPLLAVWDGLTVGGGTTTDDALQPFVNDALNELEYLMGDTSTTWGALRASHGYPDPFDIPYVEIGNEDFLNNGLETYQDRFNLFYDAFHQAYPNITIVASTSGLAETGCSGTECGIDISTGVLQDVHQYLPPKDLIAKFNFFDNVDRNAPILVGEYASTTFDNGSTTYFPTMAGSTAEAVYMIGMERNSDVVKMSCFAPILEHFDMAQWSPDAVGYDAANGVTRSTSWFVQQLFSANRGDTILPVESDSGFGPAYWVASSAGNTNFVKLANYGDASQTISINIDGKTTATLTQLSGGQEDSNTPGEENVQPVVTAIDGNGTFSFSLPAWSVSVLVAQ
ncbi:hypothetical protein AAFC00_005070 [Neodothiora populina]|uniref:non-reducing end alpha-L-arabinofuranosidase n=1 Tax=Neodothiora populina TaxID=2781224 RepID=A0ABR3PJP6_9PEZI